MLNASVGELETLVRDVTMRSKVKVAVRKESLYIGVRRVKA